MTHTLKLSQINTIQDVQKLSQSILPLCHHQNTINKSFINQLFDCMLQFIKKPSSSPTSKFLSIMILKIFTEKNQTKVLSLLSKHQLFQYMQQVSEKVDPKKEINEKGKSIFITDEVGGNNYINLILELIVHWGQRFQTTKNNQSSKFKKALNRLIKSKVILPKQFKFIKKKQLNNQLLKKQSNISNDIKIVINKIQDLMSALQDAESSINLSNTINNYHQTFRKDLLKFENYNQIEKYLLMMSFLNRQNKFYQENMIQKDYGSYIDNLNGAFQEIYGDYFRKNIKSQRQSKNNQYQQIKSSKNYQNINISDIKQEQQSESLFYEKKQSLQQKYISIDKTSQKKIQYKRDSRTPKILQNLKLYERNSSISSGFRSIKQSLEKQCSLFKQSKLRCIRSHQSLLKSQKYKKQNNKKSINLTKRSKNIVNQKIFDGQQVISNLPFKSILQKVKDQQKRIFKISHFKNKYILFENEAIQIGYKSQQIREKNQNLEYMMKFEIYIGNKLDIRIENFSISLTQDGSFIIYINPKILSTEIQNKTQLKYSLVLIPNKVPFQYLEFDIKYTINDHASFYKILLPTSITKLCNYCSLTQLQFDDNWQQSFLKLKTLPFQLNPYFSPEILFKLIPPLKEYTKNSQYFKRQIQNEYVIGGMVDLIKQLQFLLRINIDPDFQVVIQIAVINQPTNSQLQLLKFYLSTMQQLLKDD